ncbi:uncharacterized protein P174DRAFT_448675 [Aspergillus novofumigatus IBT 16806]|uniref:Uncharacterized protein n=1 Tax=Aspergillus novofumigatus (strain IBT 16806) TaxID=1392255 RepID=A0A2I1CH90_ASPN1|nr:uncharacterized protein P174DRAFT_448675 [Aspergillus novofumigatus IBT 16806]PKX97002.1 hypothetical protein P174DRAFT_448675 [Aspergillus novofumigatus IBT 16806]
MMSAARDYLFDAEANRIVYDFWCKKLPHYFGVKRPCLEETYFEQFNRENVEVVDIKDNPIVASPTPASNCKTAPYTRSTSSASRPDSTLPLADGTYTYLGLTVSGYPYMFHPYGPQGPTLLSNGPTTVEGSGRWIADAVKQIERQGIKYIDPLPESALHVYGWEHTRESV